MICQTTNTFFSFWSHLNIIWMYAFIFGCTYLRIYMSKNFSLTTVGPQHRHHASGCRRHVSVALLSSWTGSVRDVVIVPILVAINVILRWDRLQSVWSQARWSARLNTWGEGRSRGHVLSQRHQIRCGVDMVGGVRVVGKRVFPLDVCQRHVRWWRVCWLCRIQIWHWKNNNILEEISYLRFLKLTKWFLTLVI